jgi:hypothetical protein
MRHRRPSKPSPSRTPALPKNALPKSARPRNDLPKNSPPNSFQQTPFQRELSTKRRGELSELAFALAATRHGFIVSKPLGDCQRYDVVLDPSRAEDQLTIPPCPCEFCKPVLTSNVVAPSLSLRSVQGQGWEDGKTKVAAPSESIRSVQQQRREKQKPKQPRPSKFYNQQEHHQQLHHPRQPLLRVQVKSSTQIIDGLYRINSGRRLNGRVVPYKLHEIDFIAAYIIPEDSWFILPLSHVLGQVSLLFRPKKSRKPGQYDNYREAWHYLTEPQSLEF